MKNIFRAEKIDLKNHCSSNHALNCQDYNESDAWRSLFDFGVA